MANEKNRHAPFTSEEARIYGSEGGKKAAQSRKKHKLLKEIVKTVLDTKVTDPQQLEYIQNCGLPVPKKPTHAEFVAASMIIQMTKRCKPDDFLKLMQIVGETQESEQRLNISFVSEEVKNEIESLIDEIDELNEKENSNDNKETGG